MFHFSECTLARELIVLFLIDRNRRNTDDVNVLESKNKLDSSQRRSGDSSLSGLKESQKGQPLKRFKRDDSENSKTLKMDEKYARRVREQLQIFNNLQLLKKSIAAFL